MRCTRLYCCCVLLGCLAGCAGTATPQQKQLEAIAKRNPLDMADEDAKTVVVGGKQKKPQLPKVPTLNAKEAPFISGKQGKIYHIRSCQYAGKLDSPVGYASCDDAEKSGRIACDFCKPREAAQ